MKKTGLLFLLFILLAGGAYYAIQYQGKTKNASSVSPDMDFAVQDTASVGRIFMANRNNETVLLERQSNGVWMYNGNNRARATAVQALLEMFKQVRVWYIPPEAAEDNMIKSLATEGIKVEVYDKEKHKMKAFYVGGVTNDERGTYMMMEGAERPYITHMPSLSGGLRARLFFGDDLWRDRTVFAERPETIQSIAVEYPKQKSESFKLEKSDAATYDIKPFFSTTPESKASRKKGHAEAYLLQYEQLIAEAQSNDYIYKDSIKALVPFAIITLKTTNGTVKQARFWPSEMGSDVMTNKEFVVRYLAETSWGDFVLVQQHVFGKVFMGYSSFFEGRDVGDSRFKK